MKKIIYSFVIMIAAGSLFTSCVTNTEPQGIKDLREAKAGYLDALANLRAADAEKVKAEAAVEQAKAATEQARAALVQAAAKAKEIENDFVSDTNAIHIAKAKAEAEVYLAEQEKALAVAEEALRAYLVKVEEQSKQLTWTEQQIVWAYTQAYNNVIAKQKTVREKEQALFEATYNEKGELSVEAKKAAYEDTVAKKEASVARLQAWYDEWAAVAEEDIAKYDVWADEYQKLQDSIKGYEYDKAELKKANEIKKIEYQDAFDNFFKTLAKAQENVQKYVADAKPFSLVYTRATKNAFELPDPNVSFFSKFENAVNSITNERGNNIKVKDGEEGTKVLSVNFNDSEKASKAIFGDEKHPNDASLASIIDALKRDSVVVDQLIKDTAGISAAVAKVKKDYEDTKKALVAGVDAYKPIAEAKEAEEAAEEAFEAAQEKFKADTVDLFKAIRTTLDAINTNISYEDLRNSDSLAVWNAFIDIMKYREQVFDSLDAKDTRLYYKFYKGVAEGLVVVPVKDSVKYSELKFEGVVLNAHHEATYGGYKDGNDLKFGNAFSAIFAGALFGSNDKTAYESTENCFQPTTQIKFDDLLPQNKTDNFCKTFFGDWWRIPDTGKIAGARCNAYESKAVKEAKADYETAQEDVDDAKDKYYEDIYCHFWGLEKKASISATGLDSLKINYSEKTYTDPYVIPVFSAKQGEKEVYRSSDSTFLWGHIDYNKDNSELELIEDQLDQNNIKIKDETGYDYTLYAKTLAAAQIEALAKNWKENTTALAEIEEVVAAVEAAYAEALVDEKVNKAVADSVVTAYLGEDIVEAALKDDDEKTATDIWNEEIDASTRKYVVVAEGTDLTNTFVNNSNFIDIESGEFKLGGVQLAAAEEYIPNYAAEAKALHKAMEDIKSAQTDCSNLETILSEYVRTIARLDDKFTYGDPTQVAQQIATSYGILLSGIQNWIAGIQEEIAVEKGKIAKLEAGYDQTQIDIESAQDELEKAQAKLKEAEVKLAAAEAAYKAVLEAHGITE